MNTSGLISSSNININQLLSLSQCSTFIYYQGLIINNPNIGFLLEENRPGEYLKITVLRNAISPHPYN